MQWEKENTSVVLCQVNTSLCFANFKATKLLFYFVASLYKYYGDPDSVKLWFIMDNCVLLKNTRQHMVNMILDTLFFVFVWLIAIKTPSVQRPGSLGTSLLANIVCRRPPFYRLTASFCIFLLFF